ncbi:SpoIIE family protein phosphatase [Devosia sp. A449]
MKIRHIILGLTLALGLALVVVAATLVQEELARVDNARRLEASNSVRERLLVASTALAQERTRSYVQLLTGDLVVSHDSGTALRAQVDLALLEARRELIEQQAYLQGASPAVELIASLEGRLQANRRSLDELLSEAPTTIEVAASWLDSVTALVEVIQSSRLDLLRNNRPIDPVISAEANIRSFTDVLHEAVAYNEAIGVALLTHGSAGERRLLVTMERNIGRIELAWQLVDDEVTTMLPSDVRGAIAAAYEIYARTYNPLQVTLINAAPNLTRPILLRSWTQNSKNSLDSLSVLQRTLLDSSRVRLAGLVRQAQQSAIGVALLAVLGALAAALIVLVVRRRITQPLMQVSEAMVRLAANDLTTPAPRARSRDEVGQMTNALRTFKANAIQRQRTQLELQQLHLSLQETYDQLRRDLEAAARIQQVMLPAPGTIDSVRHSGFYMPSSLIAGDTYNVTRKPDGTVGFFQIDVAGHGAAAALVSVAGQHTLSQALLTRREGESLEQVLATVNEQWPADLPYFTTIFGEIDATEPRAKIVQAGHPCPVYIRSDGTVQLLGESGYPIGMLSQASYDGLEIEFGQGDRLLIYSDGVVETENRAGEFYSQDRLLELIESHALLPIDDILAILQTSLRNWRGGATLTDDVSVLIVERKNPWDPKNAFH